MWRQIYVLYCFAFALLWRTSSKQVIFLVLKPHGLQLFSLPKKLAKSLALDFAPCKSYALAFSSATKLTCLASHTLYQGRLKQGCFHRPPRKPKACFAIVTK
jgi:hypothetical protein